MKESNPQSPMGNFDLSASIARADEEITYLHSVEAAKGLFEKINLDPKTGLYNQEAWTTNLEREVKTFEPGDNITVYVADLNGFKNVNDTLSHDKGDDLLGHVGSVMGVAFQRKGDVVAHGSRGESPDNIARLSGDEFAVSEHEKHVEVEQRVGTPNEKALRQIQRANQLLVDSLQGTEFDGFDVSMAIGYAIYEPGETAQSLFARADVDMFETKYRDKLDALTDEDRSYLAEAIPRFEGVGCRVETWLKDAVLPPKA